MRGYLSVAAEYLPALLAAGLALYLWIDEAYFAGVLAMASACGSFSLHRRFARKIAESLALRCSLDSQLIQSQKLALHR